MRWKEQERKADFHVGGNTRGKKQKWAWLGSECASWCCQQCLVFISCLVLNPVWLATAWFGVWLVYWISRFVVSKCRGGCVAWNVSFFEATSKDWSPRTVREGQRLESIGVHHLLYLEMSVTTFCLGGRCVFAGVSLHWCRCKLWPASMCQLLVSQNG